MKNMNQPQQIQRRNVIQLPMERPMHQQFVDSGKRIVLQNQQGQPLPQQVSVVKPIIQQPKHLVQVQPPPFQHKVIPLYNQQVQQPPFQQNIMVPTYNQQVHQPPLQKKSIPFNTIVKNW